MSLTKRQQGIVSRLTDLKTASVLMTFFGLVGILYGLYELLYGHNRACDAHLVRALTLISFGFFVQGCLLTNACNIIRKLRDELNKQYERNLDRI